MDLRQQDTVGDNVGLETTGDDVGDDTVGDDVGPGIVGDDVRTRDNWRLCWI
jgi:hypothetical protein